MEQVTSYSVPSSIEDIEIEGDGTIEIDTGNIYYTYSIEQLKTIIAEAELHKAEWEAYVESNK